MGPQPHCTHTHMAVLDTLSLCVCVVRAAWRFPPSFFFLLLGLSCPSVPRSVRCGTPFSQAPQLFCSGTNHICPSNLSNPAHSPTQRRSVPPTHLPCPPPQRGRLAGGGCGAQLAAAAAVRAGGHPKVHCRSSALLGVALRSVCHSLSRFPVLYLPSPPLPFHTHPIHAAFFTPPIICHDMIRYGLP